ncbi:hypothetical protein C3E78_02360 [Aeromicrobium chenweiae]|uniref:Uncharacterized protein n=1 Tax=Aeromicrobium chenweiae TaxID=2079793 RepID=A0A2S0WIJ4_9ACTN|nr:hypothetical protein C3E78_02360 [Aeromicrobium chenweiae]
MRIEAAQQFAHALADVLGPTDPGVDYVLAEQVYCLLVKPAWLHQQVSNHDPGRSTTCERNPGQVAGRRLYR